MHYSLGLIALAMAPVCSGGITGLADHRTADLSYLHFNQPFNIEGGYSEVSADPGVLFAGSFENSLRDPGIGLFLDVSLSYSSTISTGGFYSVSTASASSVEPDVGFTYASIGFSNQVVFELDGATTFSINAEFVSDGHGDGGLVQIDRIVDGESFVAYSTQALNSALSVNDVITLGAGTYRYSAINWVGIDTIGRDDAGLSALTADVAVIPAPGVLLGLIGFGVALSSRRRREI